MAIQDGRTLVEVDSRRRISLGLLAEHERYIAEVDEEGTITLTPALVITAAEARLRSEPETARRIDEFLANPEIGVRLKRPPKRKSQR